MALIFEEAQRLTLPRLKTKIIATNLKRGPSLLTARLPCIHDDADTLKLLFETQSEVGSSLVDPYPASGPVTGTQTAWTGAGNAINGASRPSQELFVGWKQMQRFADVHDAHQFDQRFFARQQVEINKQYQYLLGEWNDYMINGKGHNDLAFTGWEYWLDYTATFRPEVKIFGTDDGTVSGNPQPFSLAMIRNLITTVVCGEFDAIVTDLDTFNALMTLLEAAGGNTAPMLMAESFGATIMSNGQYAGVPVVVSDDVAPKFSYTNFDINAVDGLDQVNVDPSDYQFRGFSDLDVGRVFTMSGGATFGGGNPSTTIAAYIDAYTVQLADAADAAVPQGTRTFTADAGNAMYAVRFSEDDGFHFRHPAANGSVPEGVYPCLPAVCGLTELILGHLQSTPNIFRTSVALRGQFAIESAYGIARLSGFELLV